MSSVILPPNSTILQTLNLVPQILTNVYTISNNNEFLCITNNNAYESITLLINMNNTSGDLYYQNSYVIPSGMSAIIINTENAYIGYDVYLQSNNPNAFVTLATNATILDTNSLYILVPNLSNAFNLINASSGGNLTTPPPLTNQDIINALGFTPVDPNATNIDWVNEQDFEGGIATPSITADAVTSLGPVSATYFQSNEVIYLAGATSGSLMYGMPEQGAFKVFKAYFNSYVNDTATDLVLTFPTPFVYPPIITQNTIGLSVIATLTNLIILAPNNNSNYTGYIFVEGA